MCRWWLTGETRAQDTSRCVDAAEHAVRTVTCSIAIIALSSLALAYQETFVPRVNHASNTISILQHFEGPARDSIPYRDSAGTRKPTCITVLYFTVAQLGHGHGHAYGHGQALAWSQCCMNRIFKLIAQSSIVLLLHVSILYRLRMQCQQAGDRFLHSAGQMPFSRSAGVRFEWWKLLYRKTQPMTVSCGDHDLDW